MRCLWVKDKKTRVSAEAAGWGSLNVTCNKWAGTLGPNCEKVSFSAGFSATCEESTLFPLHESCNYKSGAHEEALFHYNLMASSNSLQLHIAHISVMCLVEAT